MELYVVIQNYEDFLQFPWFLEKSIKTIRNNEEVYLLPIDILGKYNPDIYSRVADRAIIKIQENERRNN